MKTIVLQQPGKFIYTRTSPDASLEPDEAMIKIHRIGICGTDYHAFAGNQPFFTYPRILGHELGVEVVATGAAVKHVQTGDRCAVEPYLNTQQDQAVRRGFTNCGENVSVLGVHQDGGMREYMKVPARYLHASASLSYEQLALVEPLGIGCHAVNRAAVTPQDTVLVIGAGPIGMGAAAFAVAAGARTVVMDINADRLAFVAAALDIAATLPAGRPDTEAQLRACFSGDLPTVVFDATGNKSSMGNALHYVAPAGKVVFIGLFQGDFCFHDPYFHKKEITLMASRNALPADFRQIIGMMEQGSIQAETWITHCCSFEEMVSQFDGWLQKDSKVVKAIVGIG